MTTFGLALRDGGRLGITPVADGLAFKTTEPGEIVAVDRMCGAIPSGSSVVIVDSLVSRRLTEVVRGMCGYPTAVIGHPQLRSVEQVVRGIEQAGRRPVLLARKRSELMPYGNAMREIMVLHTEQDTNTWTAPPRDTTALKMQVWMLEPVPLRSGGGDGGRTT